MLLSHIVHGNIMWEKEATSAIQAPPWRHLATEKDLNIGLGMSMY